jgi:Domain of Unknown Function with PDB structure (DUF3857)
VHRFSSMRFVCALILLCPLRVSPARFQEKPPGLPAQIELLETRVRFEANGDSRKEVHTRVHINNELGARQFARLAFDYNRSFQQIEFPLVRITHSGGGTVDILPSAISDQPNPVVINAPAYQDVRVKSVRILGLAPGDILEYRVVTTTLHHPLAPDFWLDHTFDRSGVTANEIFELDLPASRQVEMRVSAATPFASSDKAVIGDSDYILYKWNVSRPSLADKKADSLHLATESDIVVTTFSSWSQLSERLRFFLHPGFSTQIWADSMKLTRYPKEPVPDRLLYDLVRTKITTLNLPLDFSSFPLREASQVLASRYGRPEEKVELLLVLHFQQTLQRKLNYRVVAYTDVESPEGRLPRPSLLKGLLLVISESNRDVYLDPSVDVAPFGVIRADLRGKKALVLAGCSDREYSCWKSIPVNLPFPSFQRVGVDAAVSNDGALIARVHYTMRGDNELLLRVAFHESPKEKWKEVAQLLALSDGFRGKITNVTASDPYATKTPFTVEYEITQPKFVDWSKKPVRIPALLPQLGLPDPPAKPTAGAATSAIDLGTPLDVETHLTLRLPTGTAARIPTGTSVVRDYATFASKYQASAAAVTASRHLNFLSREVPANRAADYNAFVRAVQSDEAQEFTLERTGAETSKQAASATSNTKKN